MRVASLLVVVAALAALAGPAQAQELRPQLEGEVVEVSVVSPDFEAVEFAAARVVWHHEFTQWPGSQSLRLRFGDISVAHTADAVEVLIQDRSGAVVDRYGGETLADLGGTWSLVIPGDYALLSVVASEPPVGLRVVVDAVARTTTPGVPQSIIGPSELQSIADYAHDPFITALARPVAKLSFVIGGLTYVCTGFMIAPDLLMTNEHCVADQQTCWNTIVTFGYQLAPGGLAATAGQQYRCASLVAANHELDAAILFVERSPGLQWGTLELANREADAGEGTMIIQHPGGRPKMISIIECAVTQPVVSGRRSATDVAHRCDTEGGSSGSPILDMAGRAIGLHHFGVGEGAFWNENRGVRMVRILGAGVVPPS